MPITWGSGPAIPDRISGYDIVQFSKFFRLMGLDFSITCVAGKWEVAAWGDAADNQIYSSGHHETLEEALIGCYAVVRRG